MNIAESLKLAAKECERENVAGWGNVMSAAVDEIDRLTAENKRLHILFAESCSSMRAEGPYEGLGQCPQIEELEAENAKLQRAVDNAVMSLIKLGCSPSNGCEDPKVENCEYCWREWLMRDGD